MSPLTGLISLVKILAKKFISKSFHVILKYIEVPLKLSNVSKWTLHGP